MTSSNGQEENPPSTSIEETENIMKSQESSSRTENPSNAVDNNKESTSDEAELDAKVSRDMPDPEESPEAFSVEYKEEQLFECEHESGDELEDLEEDDDEDDDDDDEEEDKFYDDDTQFVNSVRPPPTSISTIRLCQQNRPR